MAAPLSWQGARLAAHRDLAPDVRLFEIAPESAFVPPEPGSHLLVAVMAGERPDQRAYSTVGACADGRYRIAVKRLPRSRGGSAYLWGLAPGARLSIGGPRNHFPLGRAQPETLLVAGGIGITPIYGMALALAAAGARFRVLYTARRRADLVLAEELRDRIGDRLRLLVTQEGARVDFPAEIAALHPRGELYLCGPIGMLDAAKAAWRASGRPREALRFETFGSGGRLATEPFRVAVPRLGLDLAVPDNQSLLDALEAAGVAMIADCRRGECGLCALPILGIEGEVDHRDVFFSDEEKAEGAKLCTCVSRAVGRLVLDTPDR
ncbi:PDR/VanB family oxidoreductase [Methylobacterium sp. JK268]